MNPLKNTLPLLGQLVKHIPAKLPDTLARKHKIQTRSFSPTSHVVTMMYAQLPHALSLNDVCDALQNHQSYLSQIRDCTPPSRNGLSHANLTRNADMAEELFWTTLQTFKADYPEAEVLLLYRGEERRVVNEVLCVPCEQFLRGLKPDGPLILTPHREDGKGS